eukprot:m.311135 g.311135  ORF g.311135 m.311135 type:complete len:256 (+) comp60691_c0_seq1:28-795(+)
MTQENLDVFKLPRGFLKILELVFAVAAFATLSSFSSRGKVIRNGSVIANNGTDNFTEFYPFVIEYDFGSNELYFEDPNEVRLLHVNGKHQAGAGFFVFVGVLAFFYTIAASAAYVFLERRLGDAKLAIYFIVDFVCTVVLAFFWFVAGCEWAAATGQIPGIVDSAFTDFLVSRHCKSLLADEVIHCTSEKPGYVGIVVAAILAFLNVVLWAGNGWFTFKETKWFTKQQSQSDFAKSALTEDTSQSESEEPPPRPV